MSSMLCICTQNSCASIVSCFANVTSLTRDNTLLTACLGIIALVMYAEILCSGKVCLHNLLLYILIAVCHLMRMFVILVIMTSRCYLRANDTPLRYSFNSYLLP